MTNVSFAANFLATLLCLLSLGARARRKAGLVTDLQASCLTGSNAWRMFSGGTLTIARSIKAWFSFNHSLPKNAALNQFGLATRTLCSCKKSAFAVCVPHQ